uniref:Uncharacterized protein MANES_10G103900 n=1 Tax=Rhizophora mucronata TaxID=61149 RepID=A0A2P2JMF0_RHIMU
MQMALSLCLLSFVSVGVAFHFLVPKPVEASPQAWQLLAIFLSTVASSPLSVGAWEFLGLKTSIVTITLTFSTALCVISNSSVLILYVSQQFWLFPNDFITNPVHGSQILRL